MAPRALFIQLGVSVLALFCAPASARTIVVHRGDSIRAALAGAVAGDRIQVLPGIYREGMPGDLSAISVSANGIEIVGVSSPTRPVILENAGHQSFGIWISPADSMGAAAQTDPEHPPAFFRVPGSKDSRYPASRSEVLGRMGCTWHALSASG